MCAHACAWKREERPATRWAFLAPWTSGWDGRRHHGNACVLRTTGVGEGRAWDVGSQTRVPVHLCPHTHTCWETQV